MERKATVFIIDDDVGACESLAALVTKKGLTAEVFASPEEFLARYDPSREGCIVVDLRLPSMAGLDLLRQLKARKNSIPVVAITRHADIPTAVKAMQEGAVSFLEKPCQEKDLWEAIEQALAIDHTQHARRRERLEVERRLATLTPDEAEVLRRLLAGQPNKRIASELDLGLRTVELRRSNIMRKMQATSVPDLVRMAILAGFFPIEAAAAEPAAAVSAESRG